MKRILLLFILFSLSCYSQSDRYWSGNGSSDNISDAGNWFGGVNPTSGDNLYFNNTGGNCGVTGRKYINVDYGSNSYFSNIIAYNCASDIAIYGQNVYAYKFENFNSNVFFSIATDDQGPNSEIGNRIGANLEINPVGSGGIIITCSKISIDNLSGSRTLNVYGSNSLIINASIYEKNGVGMLAVHGANVILNAQNTYTGLTTINSGTVQLNRTGGGTLPATNDVVVGSGATLRVSKNQTLNTITLNGGTITVDAGVVLTVKNLITNGGTISGTGNLRINEVLTVNAGTFTTNDNVTLTSVSGMTARVAPVAGTILGTVTVERFIPQGKRAFRFLTPGVTTTNFILNNWQLATHITGSTTGANGFDATGTGNPSMYTYNNQVASGTGWTPIASTDATNLIAGTGYRMLIRGDRTPSLLTTASQENMNAAITLSAKGTLTTGTVTLNASSTPAINNTTNTTTDGFSLVGNPYVSPIDWNAVTKTGLTDAYYAFDSNLGATTVRGKYVSYSTATGLSSIAPGDGTSNVGQFIQSGQAFMVKNSVAGTAGSLTFNESNKATTQANVFKSTTTNNALTSTNAVLRLSVYDPNELALASYPIDGTVAVFGSDFSNDLGYGDVEKLNSAGENLGLSRNNKTLSIEALAPVQNNDELLVKTTQFQANKSYTFKIKAQDFATDVTAYLVDQYLNTQTAIDMTADNFKTFSTTSDVNSYGADRFKIVFNTTALGNGGFERKALAIYPNPVTNNTFNIALPSAFNGDVKVAIYNLVGQEVYKTTQEAQETLTITPRVTLSQGVYVVQVTNNGTTTNSKITIQ